MSVHEPGDQRQAAPAIEPSGTPSRPHVEKRVFPGTLSVAGHFGDLCPRGAITRGNPTGVWSRPTLRVIDRGVGGITKSLPRYISPMDRHSILKSAAVAAGVGLVGVARAQVLAQSGKPARVAAKVRARKSIEAADGTRLFHRDWGEGRPVLFAGPWGSTRTGGSTR
jgi:hypothetical protein